MVRSLTALEAAEPDLREHLEKCLKKRWRKFRKRASDRRTHPSEEEVHQLRVEARRVMAVLAVLHLIMRDPDLNRVEQGVREAFKGSAGLRDNHVRAQFIEDESESFPELKPLRKVLQKKEKRLHRRLRQSIGSVGKRSVNKAIRRARKNLKVTLQSPGAQKRGLRALLREVTRAHHGVIVLLRQARNGSPARIHRVRIAFKKFRYLVEVLEPLIPGLSPHDLRRMQMWQDRMGEIQDTALLQTFIAKRARKTKDEMLRRFRMQLDKRLKYLTRRFLETAEALLDFWPPARGPLVRNT